MFQKQHVSFPVDGGIDLSAWLFVPEHRSGDVVLSFIVKIAKV